MQFTGQSFAGGECLKGFIRNGIVALASPGFSVRLSAFESQCAVLDSAQPAAICYGWGVMAMIVITETRFFPLNSSGP
jgi:hypothetical protein